MTIVSPQPSEYDDFYQTYVGKVPADGALELLARAPTELEALLAAVPDDQEGFAYEPGKWSIREVVGHVTDAERLFAYRALHMARGDEAPLPGMDHEQWMAASGADLRPLSDQLPEFRAVREANLRLFRSFDDAALERTGVASGCRFTVRALIYIIAGHELHHRGVLTERYLPALEAGRIEP